MFRTAFIADVAAAAAASKAVPAPWAAQAAAWSGTACAATAFLTGARR